jgi:hypothetical protein
MAAKFFTGLPLDGPGPECVIGHGEAALIAAAAGRPHPGPGHSHPKSATSEPVLFQIGHRPSPAAPPVRAYAENPLGGL